MTHCTVGLSTSVNLGKTVPIGMPTNQLSVDIPSLRLSSQVNLSHANLVVAFGVRNQEHIYREKHKLPPPFPLK